MISANLNSGINYGIKYTDEKIGVVDNIREIDLVNDEFKMDVYVAVLITCGHASLSINNNIYNIHEKQILICHPNIILSKTMISADTKIKALIMSPEYAQDLFMYEQNSVNMKIFIEDNPVLDLDDDEIDIFCKYYELLKNKLTREPMPHHREVIDSLLNALKYDFTDSIFSKIKIKHSSFTSADNIYKQFMMQLDCLPYKYHSVAFYADKLNISPKYFSAVCKKQTNMTAIQLIDRAVIKDAETLLKRDDLNIKQITTMLGFPNQSFFGRYIKKHLGYSPQQYRDKLIHFKFRKYIRFYINI